MLIRPSLSGWHPFRDTGFHIKYRTWVSPCLYVPFVWSCFATRFAEAMSYVRHPDAALPVRFQVLIGMPFLCLHRISPFCSPADDFFSMDITFPSRLRPTWFCLFPLHLNYFCPSLFSRHRSSSGSIDFMAGLRVLFLSDADPLSFTDITFAFSTIKVLFNIALMEKRRWPSSQPCDLPCN